MFFDKRRHARVDALVIRGDERFQVFVSRAGVEDADGGIDFVHGEDGQLFIQCLQIFPLSAAAGRVFGTDLPDDDVAYDLIAVQDGRKAFQKSGMAGINGTAVRFFAFRKGAPVAFEAFFVHGTLFT